MAGSIEDLFVRTLDRGSGPLLQNRVAPCKIAPLTMRSK